MINQPIIAVLLTLFFGLNTRAQNLIPNGSFESYTSCPVFSGQWHRCTDWNNVNMNVGPGMWATPDYFTACGTSSAMPPATFYGTCTPQSGGAMMGICLYNSPYPECREYLAAKLKCSLLPGSTYTLTFWITNGTRPACPYTVSNIGAHFSTGPLSQTGFNLISNITPQCEITEQVAITQWKQYSFVFTASAAWDHITIGNFRPDAQNNVTKSFPAVNTGVPSGAYGYYFIDNIELYGPTSGGSPLSLGVSVDQPAGCGAKGSATITSAQGGLNYLWQPGNYSSAAVSGLDAGTYTVTVANPVTCGSSGTIQVTIVNKGPQLSAGSRTVCTGQQTQLAPEINGGAAPFTYTWTPGNLSSPGIVVTPSAPVIYTVTVKDNAGCTATTTLGVAVTTVVAALNYNFDPCSGLFRAKNTSVNATAFSWSFGNQATSALQHPEHVYTANGNYQVILEARNGDCSDTASLNLHVELRGPVTADFAHYISGYTDNAGNIQFNNLSTPHASYFWDFGDGYVGYTAEPAHTYTTMGTYQVCLVATNNYGCSDTLCRSVDIELDWTLYIPNTFTPDGNDRNDIFYAYATNIQAFTIRIFDRWGEELFRSDQIGKGWDGLYKGEPVKNDVYAWTAEFTDYHNKKYQRQGHVMVLR